MEKKEKSKFLKVTKGERLNWQPIQKGASVVLTPTMIQSRNITVMEIKTRQAQSYSGHQITLLVP